LRNVDLIILSIIFQGQIKGKCMQWASTLLCVLHRKYHLVNVKIIDQSHCRLKSS